jgi:hypothetical protein
MPFIADVLKVMIASPSDVANERQAIRDLVSEWNYIHAEDRKLVLMPVGWETHSTPTMGERPQAIINKQVLANCDLLVAVFWTRLGSPTGQAASGTVEEIEEHLDAGKPAMLYFSSVPLRPDSVSDEQYKALTSFKEECYRRGLVESYDSLPEFRDKFSRQLAQTIIRDFADLHAGEASGAISSATSGPTPLLVRDVLSDDAKRLLLAAATTDGHIIHVRHSGGTEVQAGKKNFIAKQTPREVARWRSALQELITHALVEERGYKGEVFEVTYDGHQVAEEISEENQYGESSDA